MDKKELIKLYDNYKSLLSTTVTDIVSFNSWSDEFSRKELKRIYELLIKEFKFIDFGLFSESELEKLDFKWFDDDLMCMPTWVLDCLPPGIKVYSINNKEIIIKEDDKLSKDSRYGISTYGFKRYQIRDSKINEILNDKA